MNSNLYFLSFDSLKSKDYAVLVALKRTATNLQVEGQKKIIPLDVHMGMAIAG